jgi:hypothetical protein
MVDRPTQNESPSSVWDGSGRTFWFSDQLNEKTLRRDRRRRSARAAANIVASLCEDGSHMPTLDIDHPALLTPSSTPGHHHLFVDVPMTWRAYRRLLRALYLAGVIGRNAYWRSLDRGASFVRPPGVMKSPEELERAQRGRGDQRRAATRALWVTRVRVTLKRIRWNLGEAVSAVVHRRTP